MADFSQVVDRLGGVADQMKDATKKKAKDTVSDMFTGMMRSNPLTSMGLDAFKGLKGMWDATAQSEEADDSDFEN